MKSNIGMKGSIDDLKRKILIFYKKISDLA